MYVFLKYKCFFLLAWDILSLGNFIAGMFCIWDVLQLGCFEAGDFLYLGHFVAGML
jgi:hypothetical protein